MKYEVLALALLLGLAGCGGGSDEEAEPAGVIPQHQLDAMEKAKNVEDVLQQAEEQRRDPD